MFILFLNPDRTNGVTACIFSILYNKRFNVFHFPVSEEEVPDYRSVIHKPMDMATVLQRVDSGQYLTRAAFMNDIDLIVSNAKVHLLENLFFDSCYICGGLSGECFEDGSLNTCQTSTTVANQCMSYTDL